MDNSHLDQLRKAVYEQRQLVSLLQNQTFPLAGELLSSEKLTQLRLAQEELLGMQEELTRRETEKNAGVLLDTTTRDGKPFSEYMGDGKVRIGTKITLRQSCVPTGIVHLLDTKSFPLISVFLEKSGRGTVRLCVRSKVEGYSAETADTVELIKDIDPIEIPQLPTFFPQAISTVDELTRATLSIQIDNLDGAVQIQKTFPIWLLSRNSAYLWIKDPSTGEKIDLTPYLASWVTPNIGDISLVLRAALEFHPEKWFLGYLTDASGVEAQVRSIYMKLAELQIQYSVSGLVFGGEDGSLIQRVRTPKEVLDTKLANCLDGTLLMSSLLEAITIEPAIVLVPGHAFLAWRKQKQEPEWEYLETTLIGKGTFDQAIEEGRLRAKIYGIDPAKIGTPGKARMLPLSDLRVRHGITPMQG
jgi:hypothetical protein